MDKFICVGKNYLEHAKELGDAVPDKPVLFLKPPSVICRVSQEKLGRVKLPQGRGMVHYECEIILLLNEKAQVEAVSLGLDMTLRDVQVGLKKQGHPWELAKVFKDSAVVGPWIPIEKFPGYLDEPFTFSLEGVVRQNAQGREMRTPPQACLEYAQLMFPIVAGDILFTGTPAGVGAVLAGQKGELRWGDYLKYEVLFE
jgi:2-keto-4-pentenoate hydratase/2-oxohepta-3-ene-1,7-dioic acid hydratase in catechol pathway